MEPNLRAYRYAILTTPSICYACDRPSEVSALLVPAYIERDEDGEWVAVEAAALLHYVEAVDETTQAAWIVRAPRMQLAASRTAGLTYWANLCNCGAMQGDWHLHEPEGPFFPQDSAGIAAIRVEWVEAPIEARTAASQGSWMDELIRRSQNSE